jgi:tRNA threonylcarbamoyl adenosine modification protein (Sua5/YciO/YrdC/YwlC family)
VSQRIEIHPTHPQPRLVDMAAKALAQGKLLLLPSDAGYLLAWGLEARDAENRVIRLRALDTRHPFTLLCASLSDVGSLAKLDNQSFRLVKSLIPAPCTFILPAAAELPRRLKQAKRRAVGIRVPDHAVLRAVIAAYAEPILATSLQLPGEEMASHEAEVVAERMMRHVDLMLDSGDVPPGPTTIIDCLGDAPVVTREGFAPIALD